MSALATPTGAPRTAGRSVLARLTTPLAVRLPAPSSLPRHLVAAAFALSFAGAAAPALAQPAAPAPAWELHVVARPSTFSPAENATCEEHQGAVFGQLRPCDGYTVVVRNSGAAATSEPVTVTQSLAGALTPVHASGEELQRGAFGPGAMSCPEEAPLGQTVSCTYGEPIPPDGVLVIQLNVTASGAAGEAVDHVTAEGGGAPSASASASAPLDGESPSPGVADYTMAATDAAGSPQTQAGAHPYELSAHFDFDTRLEPEPLGGLGDGPVQEPRDIVAYLPLGAIGDPQAVEHCPEASLLQGTNQTACPKGSVVGTVTADLRGAYVSSGVFGGATSSIYNLQPEPGVAAEFGFTLLGQPLTMYASTVWHDGRYELRVATTALPSEPLLGLTLSFFGDPSEKSHAGAPARAFLRNPTACGGPLSSTLEADSDAEPARWDGAQTTVYPQIGECEGLQFAAEAAVAPDNSAADTPAGHEVALHVPQPDFAGLPATPDLKSATIVLPPGTAISPAAANGLVACPETGPEGIDFPHGTAHPDEAGEGEEIGPDGLSRLAAGHCPAASAIGDVTIATPLLATPLSGKLYVAAPLCGGAGQPGCSEADAAQGRLFRVYLEAAGSGVVVKLAGTVAANPATGRLTATFAENPQLPFETLSVKLRSGPRAPLANPQTCGTQSTRALLEPWGGPSTSSTSQFTISGCSATLPFAPSFTAGSLVPLAGASGGFTLTLARHDGEQDLSGLSVALAPGLLADLASVPLCGSNEAADGACSSQSRIGSATATAGSGSQPLTLDGDVYLTGPYRGAPFGLAVVVPVQAGPFNLGTEVVRAAITVDPRTAIVSATSDPLPQIKDGVPVRLKSVTVTIDRSGFMRNPTNCEAQHVGALIAAAPTPGSGATPANTQASVPFAAAGCRNLPFKPALTASTLAKTSRPDGAELHVTVRQHPGEADIRKLQLQLPLALPARNATLKLACGEAQFAADPAGCPAGSVIGSAVAHTPLLRVPLAGPAILVSHGGAAFPDVVLLLQGNERGGEISIELVGNTDIKHGITHSRFEALPDAPIGSFEADFPEGPHSIFAANGALCGHTKTVTVKRWVSVRSAGRRVRVRRAFKVRVPAALSMPTTIVGQNGAQLNQSTPVAVHGCKAPAKRRHAHHRHA